MRNSLAKKTMMAAAFLALVPASGWAIPGGEKGPGPSPEAYAACEGKKAGDPGRERGPGMKGDFRKEGGMDGSRRLERMAAVLDLTEEQKTKIRAIFEAERGKAAPLRQKMAENRAKVRQAVHGEGGEAAIRALVAEGSTLKADLLVSRARTSKEVQAVLTPEQQMKAKQLAELRGKGGGLCRNR